MKNYLLSIITLVLGALVLAALDFKPVVKTTVSKVAEDWERAKLFTRDYINSANDDAIAFKPTSEMRTFGQQMLHIAEANYIIVAATSGKQSTFNFGDLEKISDQYKNKDTLLKAVMESYDLVISTVKRMDEREMNQSIKLFNYELTKKAALEKAFEHQTHHRGQATVYLRLSGITPPNERLF
jgi:uncharacterized damage-inducible protein DinB